MNVYGDFVERQWRGGKRSDRRSTTPLPFFSA